MPEPKRVDAREYLPGEECRVDHGLCTPTPWRWTAGTSQRARMVRALRRMAHNLDGMRLDCPSPINPMLSARPAGPTPGIDRFHMPRALQWTGHRGPRR